jgi:predicted O-linked N-acetylglucosamine transferase (SPINDLY family)
MSPFSLSVTSDDELRLQAQDYFQQRQYPESAALYEQLIAREPGVKQHYWYLGLSQLVQECEAEAQLTWAFALSEEDEECIEKYSTDLIEILESEAEHQTLTENLKIAWLIRQHIQEFKPDHLNNLLKLLRLSVELDCFYPEDLIQSGLVELLQSNPSPDLDADLLYATFQDTFNLGFKSSLFVPFIEACLPYFTQTQDVVTLLSQKMADLESLYNLDRLACRYGEFCLQLEPQNSFILLQMARLYQDIGEYQKGIDIVNTYYAGCQTLWQKLYSQSLLLRGLVQMGTRWSEAETVLAQQTQLIHDFLETYEIIPTQAMDASVLAPSFFFYPYFDDRPAVVRPLQNKVAKLVQDSLQGFSAYHFPSYQPYPSHTGSVVVNAREAEKNKVEDNVKHNPESNRAFSFPVKAASDKIKVGYLAYNFKQHSVGWLCRWVFEHFDRDRFDVFVYFNNSQNSEFGDRWFVNNATHASAFNGNCYGIAQDIQQDGIDILVDLDSLTVDATCNIMALKPAPIQVTWLGLDASGIPAIDYFLADPYVLPEQAQHYYAEKIWRLPQTYIAVDGFEVGIPSIRRDRLEIPEQAIVYFSSQAAHKLNPYTIQLQMQILKSVPNSYFLIKGPGDQKGIAELFYQIAELNGVSSDRLRFLPRTSDEVTHRANLAIADVVLDTFPYNGATTTMETLWMGIPMVTRVGQQFAARNSYGMMMNAGITEGISWTDEEYVEWGIRLGQDAALRQDIHWRLMRSRQTSPLWNAKQFTKEIEKAYEQMWQIYLQS